MSIFFNALEQAERDRNWRRPPVSSPNPSPAPAAPAVERGGAAIADRPRPAARPGEIDEHLVSLLEPASFAAEQYRALRHTVEQCRRAAGHTAFAIGSPCAADGKTTTAINLAGALAQARDARVLLVEADLRCPRIAERLGLGGAAMPGLVQAIERRDLGLEDVTRFLEAYNLSVVLAGDGPAAPYELLESPRLGELLQQARADYDYVILDTPPIVSFPDCRIIDSWVDGWLIVVAAHRTSRELLGEALDMMSPSKTLGFVFTHDERFRPNSRYYGGYYYAARGRR